MRHSLYLFLLLNTCVVFAQFEGPVSKIETGYGSDGSHTVKQITIVNDHNTILKPISIFYPENISSSLPTIFYSHGYASSDTTFHLETLHHIASKGYVVVFVPYKTIGVTIEERYLTLFDGFTKAARTFPTFIDTTKVGFYGQSFGGGATPRIAYRAFTENNWGSNGKFIFCSAPWYSYELGATNLSNFPNDCNMLTVLYDDDLINDHRLGIDIFNHIAINDSIKDCLIVYSDTISDYVYQADHTLPPQYTESGEFDALDYYVTFRLMDALADYSFTGNIDAKNIALGNGSIDQLYMGGELTNLTQSDNPIAILEESVYQNPCTHEDNERSEFCNLASNINVQNDSENKIELFPNPANDFISILTSYDYQKITITVYTTDGVKLMEINNQTKIDLSSLTEGTYYSVIQLDNYSETSKLILTQ